MSSLLYRNVTDFCVFILYPATLLNSLMSSSSFLVASLEFSIYSITASIYNEKFTSFPTWFPLFVCLFLWLLWLGLLKLCSIKVATMDILFCFSSWRKCFQLFTIDYDVSCGFIIYGPIMLSRFHLCPFMESFYHKWILNVVKHFLHLLGWPYGFLFFNLLIWCIILIDL